MLPLLRHRNRTASSDETPENPEPDNPKHESMNGSRLGRGRGGRLAVYAGSLVGLLLLVMVYRAAVSEMARLREIHVQCTHDKESLAAQFQVISEYKMRIEKSLADEKSANVAAKQELEHRATIEKSQRDKDLVEANHRYNSLDQEFKTLKTQYKDYLDECAMKQQQASEEKTRLENTLQELRTEVQRAQEDRDAAKNSLENFKNKYLAVETEKGRFENMYNDMVKTNEATAMEKQKLEKHVHQLKIELEDVKRSCGQPAAPPSFVGEPNGAAPKEAEGGQDAGAAMNLAKPPAPQQSTSTTMPRLRAAQVGDGSLKSSTKGSTQPGEKSSPGVRKVKLPAGVPPIPKFEAERNPAATNGDKVEKGRGDAAEVPFEEEKLQGPVADNQVANPPHLPAAQRHPGEQAQPRQDSWAWPAKVAPGVQEIGDELSNREKIPGLEETGIRQIADGVEYGQYGADYEKDSPMKNNDLHLEEGEEEGEDGDDPLDYPILEGNNMKAGKNPE
ncbi:uncharacterized protein LOC107221542 isoform X1 [Neodiprion lecontei]|uniref:Uncharacterized protein LOC107221542 isoform X1 n=2 Tax=Neodiprion lecontei TaxID=441921 RepID=A0A6J0BQB9_NEOLC|nr:uncharacterized protein LOC107221542 isoform X1 [Neodiprion lecontei]